MSAVVASLIAVAGTLLGSFSTFQFQQKVAQRTEVTARHERLRQDRLAACTEFAAAISDLRRAVIAVWFRSRRARAAADDNQAVADYYSAHADADRLGAVAHSAKFRMLLLIDDRGLRELADGAFEEIDVIMPAADKAAVEVLDVKFEAHMSAFMAAAAQLLR